MNFVEKSILRQNSDLQLVVVMEHQITDAVIKYIQIYMEINLLIINATRWLTVYNICI